MTERTVEKQNTPGVLFMLRLVVGFCVLLGGFTLIESFATLLTFWQYVSGSLQPTPGSDMALALQTISQEKVYFLALNLYNIVVWTGVLFCSIWVLGYYTWARVVLKSLLGFDLILTCALLVLETLTGDVKLASPGLFIATNALQVGAIIIVSHPTIIATIKNRSAQRQEPDKQIN